MPGHYKYEMGKSKSNFGLDVDALHFFDAETQERIN